MTEQQQAEGQAPEAEGQAPASQQNGQAQEAGQQQANQTPQSIDDLPKWVQNEIKGLRKENAERRRKEQQREDAERTELEQANTRNQELTESLTGVTGQLREYRFADAIQLPNKEYAWLAAQRYGIEVEFDDENLPTNADAVAKELAKRDPKLFGSGNADAGEKGAAAKTGGPAESLAGMLLAGR